MPPQLKVVSMQYDNRLRVSQHQVASGEYSGGYLKKAEFVYYSDSKPKEMDDQVNAVFDRKFEYDFAGRLSRSEFGLYTTQQNTQLNPHMQDVAYDAFSQVTSRETEQWGSAASFGRTYVNGRMAGHSGETLTYDAAGNITYTGVSSNKFQDTVYDAAGRRTSYTERWIITGSSNSSIVSERVLSNKFDGAGQLVKSTNQLNRISSPASTGDVTNTYTVHSSVLGGALSEISYVGESVIKRKTSIYAGGAIIAEQRRLLDDDTVVYFHADPVTGSKQEVRQTGESIDTREGRQEVEPFGQSIRTTPPFEEEPPANPVPIVGDSLFPEWQCALPTDLIPTHCALKMIADIKGGGLWLGPTSTKNKEGNAGSVSMQWAVKLPNKKIGWADDMPRMSRALSSSTKESDDEKDANNTLKGNRIFASVEVRASDEPYEEVIGNLDVSFIPNFVDASTERGGGGGDDVPRNRGNLASFSQEKLDSCMNTIFAGVVTNGSFEIDANAGKATATYTAIGPGPDGLPELVNNSFNTFFNRSETDLARSYNATRSPGSKRYEAQSGFTSGENLSINWIASDVLKIPNLSITGLTALYIHEMGNMIGNRLQMNEWDDGYTSENAQDGTGDADVGQTLEDCVFGGRVGLRSGRIGPNREL